MTLDLKQLRYFVAMVDAGSLSAAAAVLHVAQPALSHHLKNLETSLGKTLLRREARGIAPTPEGELLYRHAAGILRQTETLELMLRRTGDQLEGRVALGLPKTASALLSVPLFERARAIYPALALELVDGHSRELGRALLEGRLDLALLMPPGPPQGCTDQALVTEELVVVCPSRADWLAPGRTLDVAQLSELPMLIANRRDRLQRVLEAAIQEHRLSFNVRGHIDELGSLLRAVAAGHGLTVLPWCAVTGHRKDAGLQFRRLRGMRLVRELHLCRATALPLAETSVAIGKLLSSVIEQMVRRGDWPRTHVHALDWPAFMHGH